MRKIILLTLSLIIICSSASFAARVINRQPFSTPAIDISNDQGCFAYGRTNGEVLVGALAPGGSSTHASVTYTSDVLAVASGEKITAKVTFDFPEGCFAAAGRANVNINVDIINPLGGPAGGRIASGDITATEIISGGRIVKEVTTPSVVPAGKYIVKVQIYASALGPALAGIAGRGMALSKDPKLIEIDLRSSRPSLTPSRRPPLHRLPRRGR